MARLGTFPFVVALLTVFGCIAGCSSAREGGTPTCSANLAAGDLTITEVMANPSGADAGKEWFEVRNNRPVSVDLAGLQLIAEKTDGTGAMIHTVRTQVIGANGYLVFGGAAPAPMPPYMD